MSSDEVLALTAAVVFTVVIEKNGSGLQIIINAEFSYRTRTTLNQYRTSVKTPSSDTCYDRGEPFLV